MRNRTLAQQNMLQKFRRFSGTWKPHQAKADGSKLEMKWWLAVFVKCLATTRRMADGKSESYVDALLVSIQNIGTHVWQNSHVPHCEPIIVYW